MNVRSTNLAAVDTSVSTAEAHRHPADRDDVASAPALGRWRVALESRWQRKIDEAIALSKACYGLSPDGDGSLAEQPVQRSRRLRARTTRAYEELAAIEDAIARLDDGSYGLCADCDQVMPGDWLAVNPEARSCPDCSLRLVPPQPPAAQRDEGPRRVQRALPKSGPGVRRRQPRPVPSATA